jgi:hypothetical protein
MFKKIARSFLFASILLPAAVAVADSPADTPQVVTGTDPEPTYTGTVQIILIFLHLS